MAGSHALVLDKGSTWSDEKRQSSTDISFILIGEKLIREDRIWKK